MPDKHKEILDFPIVHIILVDIFSIKLREILEIQQFTSNLIRTYINVGQAQHR